MKKIYKSLSVILFMCFWTSQSIAADTGTLSVETDILSTPGEDGLVIDSNVTLRIKISSLAGIIPFEFINDYEEDELTVGLMIRINRLKLPEGVDDNDIADVTKLMEYDGDNDVYLESENNLLDVIEIEKTSENLIFISPVQNITEEEIIIDLSLEASSYGETSVLINTSSNYPNSNNIFRSVSGYSYRSYVDKVPPPELILSLLNDHGTSNTDNQTYDPTLVITNLELGASIKYAIGASGGDIDVYAYDYNITDSVTQDDMDRGYIHYEIPVEENGIFDNNIFVQQSDQAKDRSNNFAPNHSYVSMEDVLIDTTVPIINITSHNVNDLVGYAGGLDFNFSGTVSDTPFDLNGTEITFEVINSQNETRNTYSETITDNDFYLIIDDLHSVLDETDNNFTISSKVSDISGNNAEFNITLLYDGLPPVAVVLDLTDDNGFSDEDNISNVGNISISEIESNAKLEYKIGSSGAWTTIVETSASDTYEKDFLGDTTTLDDTIHFRQTDINGNTGNESSIEVKLSNVPPNFAPSLDDITIAENVDNVIDLNATLEEVKFSISSEQDTVTIDEDTGLVSNNSNRLDFESNISPDHDVTVYLNDIYGNDFNDTFVITLTNVIDMAPVLVFNTEINISEDAVPSDTAIGTVDVNGTFPDENVTNEFRIVGHNAGESSLFRIDNTGNITLFGTLDFETHTTHELVIAAENDAGNSVGEYIATINVRDVNENPANYAPTVSFEIVNFFAQNDDSNGIEGNLSLIVETKVLERGLTGGGGGLNGEDNVTIYINKIDSHDPDNFTPRMEAGSEGIIAIEFDSNAIGENDFNISNGRSRPQLRGTYNNDNWIIDSESNDSYHIITYVGENSNGAFPPSSSDGFRVVLTIHNPYFKEDVENDRRYGTRKIGGVVPFYISIKVKENIENEPDKSDNENQYTLGLGLINEEN